MYKRRKEVSFMSNYRFTLAPWSIDNSRFVSDALVQTLELSFHGTSFKDALQQLYKSFAFDKYIHANATVWVYWKSNFNGKLFSVPAYEDVDIQATP